MEAITVRLENFEGPLDLLLHLIAKNKVSIYDIPITHILEQYMAVLHSAPAMDMDIAGDFIAMAAQLLLIKSKMLLPKQEAEESEDPRAQLVEMLLEYQRIKLITPYLREQGRQGRDIFVKPPEAAVTCTPPEYHHTPHDLVRAARSLLHRAERRIPPSPQVFSGIVGREPVSISAKIESILLHFTRRVRLRFSCLLDGVRSRSDIVATFLAVLELSRTSHMIIEGQDEDFTLYLAEPKEDTPE